MPPLSVLDLAPVPQGATPRLSDGAFRAFATRYGF
jgi:hypothetical protein